MNYYIGQIDIRNGEYEECSTIKFKTDGCPTEYLDTIARYWYDGENDGEDKLDDWYWHNGEVITKGAAWQSVSYDLYSELPCFISEIDIDSLKSK